VGKGQYAVKVGQITFSLQSEAGLIDFRGTLIADQIELYAYSHINQSGGDAVYSFVRWSAEQAAAPDRVRNAARERQR
jgi:hypothetical protein